MKKIFILLCIMACMLVSAQQSSAAFVDFENLAHNDDQIVYIGATYTAYGFLFTNAATMEASGFEPEFAAAGALLDGVYSGSTALINDNYLGETILTRVDGGLFNVSSISLSESFATGENEIDVEFFGTLLNGSTVFQTFSLDGSYGSELFYFGSDFNKLSSLSWTQTPDPHQFDNVDASPVPIPGALLLFGSGLISLFGIKKKFAK